MLLGAAWRLVPSQVRWNQGWHRGPHADESAERACFRAEARGFAPGGEMDDCLAAEREVDVETAPESQMTD